MPLSRGPSGKSFAKDSSGAVFIEFLIVVLPFLTLVFGLCQLALLYVGSLAVQRSASTAARAAMVVFDDDPDDYGGQARNTTGGQRAEAIEIAASFPIYALKSSPKSGDSIGHALRSSNSSPYLSAKAVAEGLTVTYPGGVGGDRGDPITVRVEYEFPCEVPVVRNLMCDGGTITITAESTMPSHAADYEYGSW